MEGYKKITIPFICSLVFSFSLLPGKIADSVTLDALLEEIMPSQQERAQKGDGISHEDREEFEGLLKEALGVSLYEDKEEASPDVLNYKWAAGAAGVFSVYATSFGKPGNEGEAGIFKDGTRVKWGVVAVALPDPSAIGRWVEVRRQKENGEKTGWVRMKIRDQGPWFRDDPYWERSGMPRAVEYFKKRKKRFDGRVVINPAGLDITPWGWQKLGVEPEKSYTYSGHVEWKFAG